MPDYREKKNTRQGSSIGYERFLDAGTGNVCYQMRRPGTRVGGSFPLAMFYNPIQRAQVASNLMKMRKGLGA
jgi:hypothetical protein